MATSVLSTIPSYYMQIAWLPQSICALIDKTTRDFIWKGTTDKGIHLGGLEQGCAASKRSKYCILGKLVWNLLHNHNKLWVQVLSDKYVKQRDFMQIVDSRGSSVWNSVIKAKAVLKGGL